MTLQPYQQRVIEERNQLAERFDKLEVFFSDPTFDTLSFEERELLRRQRSHMEGYLNALNERIDAFGV